MWELHRHCELELWEEVTWWPALVFRGGFMDWCLPGMGTPGFGALPAVLGSFPVAGGCHSFLLQSQEQSAGAAALGELTAAGAQVFTPGECKGENPSAVGPSQSLSGSQEAALRAHGRRRSAHHQAVQVASGSPPELGWAQPAHIL